MRVVINLELDPETAEINDLYATRAVLQQIDQGYQSDQLETPENVIDKISAINSALAVRNKAELERKLRAAMARREALASRDERKQKLDGDIAKLKAKLGQ